ncbi:MAG TPA: hypothetical protein VFR47_23615 [Anaerolineales bacterium]|nr:hypothetical protein [Anaerolineales bacterium]
MNSMQAKRKSCTYWVLVGVGILLGICLLLSAVSAFSNRNLPKQENSELPGPLDKARLLEALQLRAMLGDQVWPGWGSTEIPIILSNDSYEFLFDYRGQPPAEWSLIADDDLAGKPFFRRTADDPQNFAVRVGDIWTASIGTKNNMDVFLIDTFRDMFPTPIKQIFPYRFLIQPSETQLGGLLHETFHVFQYQIAPDRVTEAESIHKLGDQYESSSASLNTEWRQESALLADAMEAESQAEKINLVRQFLTIRDARRKDYQLSTELIDYERWLEWEEGTAKYIEVAILKAASESAEYQPLPEMQNDPDFNSYQKFDQRWSQELIQLRYQTTSGETQFYMTGMAQAFLLDELMPDWKDKYWGDGVFLEDLLRMAIAEDR